jgi:SAM-dependent methyltransferase
MRKTKIMGLKYETNDCKEHKGILQEVECFLNSRRLKIKNSEKHYAELKFWKTRLSTKGGIPYWRNLYFQLYCHYLDVNRESFSGKAIVDIGCGPHGAISCFDAKLKYGIDPLVNEYCQLFDLSNQDVVYLACGSEKIPLIDGAVDLVLSRNAIDHVDNVTKAVDEIHRILRHGGEILLSVNYQDNATTCEPHVINDKALKNLLEGNFAYDIVKEFPRNYDAGIGGFGQFKYPHKIVLISGTKL